MTPELLDAIREHAQQVYPDECCGVVIAVDGEPVYHPCANLAPSPGTMAPAPLDMARAEARGRVLGYAHSHPNALPTPSFLDRKSCEQTGKPWWIVECPGDKWYRLDPVSRPLFGREYIFGVDDCWSVVREWYNKNSNFEMPDYVRSKEHWKLGMGKYLAKNEELGFRFLEEGEELLAGDMIFAKVASPEITHCGVYLGNDMMLHHLDGELSRRENLLPRWLKRMSVVARHT